MTTWNYRVVRTDQHGYAIHEVYYDEENRLEYFTCEPIYPTGDTYEEFLEDLQNYYYATIHPILDEEDFAASFPLRKGEEEE